jgi:hypothetical protein
MTKLTDKEEIFCQAYYENGGNATAAYLVMVPTSKAKPESINEMASRMLANVKVSSRIAELKAQAAVVASAKFNITVEQRLKWLKDITEAGLAVYIDGAGNNRRENLAAARAAIQTMNEMLGVTEGDKKERKSYSITLAVKDASEDAE